ncbi:uncharacterized protein LOC128673107 [Plodia interpunctella]|uniref:uncharacterized protein LOC128673107 n=1 Tax=Plodia interpunctella TaxID=58824 RepID=UPI0023689558|nr:uncharacterized protein LOC128673107 [Plodia interpunctella]
MVQVMDHLTIKMADNCTVSKSDFIFEPSAVGKHTTTAVSLGTVTGIAIAVALNIVLNLKCFTTKSAQIIIRLDKKNLLRTLVLLVLVLMLPVFIVLILFGRCYKFLCSIIIRRKDKQFVRFLESFDVFWYLEGDSVINILGTIESDSTEALVENMKHKLEILIHNKTSDKIFYRKHEEYGFFYWRKNDFIDVSEYVEILDLPDQCELSETDLEDIMADVSTKPLPYNDEGLFKILITKQRVTIDHNTKEEHGIIFRIHHSVGDGFALIEFLCESLADNGQSHKNAINLSEFRNSETPDELFNVIRKLCDIPLCFADLVLRKPDENSLHGPPMLGQKHFKWTKSDENLLVMVKEIKDNVGLNFSDVIATAVAGGLRNYFDKTIAHVPDDVAVIIPVRYPSSAPFKNGRNRLNNDFTVTMFDLPVKEHKNLSTIKNRFADFRLNNEYLANYYIIQLASIFPKEILKPIFFSSQATLTLSNMPGPDVLSICGSTLKKMVFFLPLKGISGVGVSAFCYGGVLRLAVSADAALVSKADDLDYILQGMVDEIRRMHVLYAKK